MLKSNSKKAKKFKFNFVQKPTINDTPKDSNFEDDENIVSKKVIFKINKSIQSEDSEINKSESVENNDDSEIESNENDNDESDISGIESDDDSDDEKPKRNIEIIENEDNIELITRAEKLFELNHNEFMAQYRLFCKKWEFKDSDLENLELAANNFNINLRNLTKEEIKIGRNLECNMIEGFSLYTISNKDEFDDDEFLDIMGNINILKQNIQQYETIFRLLLFNKQLQSKEAAAILPDKRNAKEHFFSGDLSPFMHEPIDWGKYTEKQKLLNSLLQRLFINQYRKYGEWCYDQIYTPDGHPTHAWEECCKIQDFVIENTDQHRDNENWRIITKSVKGVQEITEKLIIHNDREFPNLEKDRHKFSFKNGIYHTMNEKIDEKTQETIYVDKFYPYESEEFTKLEAEKASANYFDQEFNYCENMEEWYDIPTPNLQKVLDYQFNNLDDHVEVCKWMYILLGRLLYSVNEIDKWQVMTYIIGEAGTGKSTLLNFVLKLIYQESEIGILDNNIEEQFGLDNLLVNGSTENVFITMGIELDHKFKLQRTDFLKMVSGDPIMIAKKGKKGHTVTWNSHLIFVGNKMFGYKDNAGELARRIISFWYDQKLKQDDIDPQLPEKLLKEIPNIIQKITKAYLVTANKYKNKSIWSVLPKYFLKTKARIAEQSSPLRAFMECNDLIYNKEYYCLESKFRSKFLEFCSSRNLGREKLSEDMYRSVFHDVTEEKGVHIYYEPKATRMYPRGTGVKRRREAFIVGLDFVDRDASDGEESEDYDSSDDDTTTGSD